MKSKTFFPIVIVVILLLANLTSCVKDPNNPKRTLNVLPDQVVYGNIDANGYLIINAQTLMAQGGNPLRNYDWTLEASPAAPEGISITPLNGVINNVFLTSTTLTPGDYTFKVKASDGDASDSEMVKLNIQDYEIGPAAVLQQWGIEEYELMDGKANKIYGASLFVMGGEPPYSWFLDASYAGSSDLTNAGLSIDEASGIVKGTILESAASTTIKFRVIVRDNLGDMAAFNPIYVIAIK